MQPGTSDGFWLQDGGEFDTLSSAAQQAGEAVSPARHGPCKLRKARAGPACSLPAALDGSGGGSKPMTSYCQPHRIAIALLLASLVCALVGCSFLPGVTYVDRVSQPPLNDDRAQYLSLLGGRRTWWLQPREIAVAYFLILRDDGTCYNFAQRVNLDYPQSTVHNDYWIGHNRAPQAGETPAQVAPLSVAVDTQSGLAIVNTDAFSLSYGNLIVVRLDSGCEPHSVQLPGTITQRLDAAEIVREFIRRLPNDARLQGLGMDSIYG